MVTITGRVLAFSPLIITVHRIILGNVNSQINTSPQAFHCVMGLKLRRGAVHAVVCGEKGHWFDVRHS